ncbi:MAG: hypothetical protein ACKOWJ_03790 [Micrococcales bacterium]
MAFEFRDSTGAACGSTEFAKELLADCTADLDASLAEAIRTESDWRANYQHYFYELTKHEFAGSLAFAKFADELPARITNSAGESLTALANRGFANRTELKYETIKGSGVRKGIDLPQVASTLNLHSATSDALHALDWVRANREVSLDGEILVALSGNAELSATKSWLDWGGTVAVLARKNDAKYAELIAHAKHSAGTLFYVEAGVDLVNDIETCAHFIRTLSTLGSRLVVASYGYAPGANQIKLQAAQIALANVAMQLPKSQVALAWLATPLDVVVADVEMAERQIAGYSARPAATRIRDSFWQLFGGLQPCAPEIMDGDVPLAVFDCSSNRQGSSYLLAKHSERWLAMKAARSGVHIVFAVAPPATTRSELGAKKILIRTYSGLARFGVRPLEASDTAALMAGILVRGLHDAAAPQDTHSTAIHAGFWSLPYRLDSVLVPASLLG